MHYRLSFGSDLGFTVFQRDYQAGHQQTIRRIIILEGTHLVSNFLGGNKCLFSGVSQR